MFRLPTALDLSLFTQLASKAVSLAAEKGTRGSCNAKIKASTTYETIKGRFLFVPRNA
jgi:hypothetical protein